ncbi:MAG: ISAs1 family transposase [Sterolibacteriaceae bacterium]|uniref:ISAs1 family transposase n=1 Tax=Candidatus Methylophosphatis roskildensis TaxID=2899263 RepID=A0A9D7HTL6_9PROT|nr:ISAs1 family transposase [Candidatus Methylophosphatis roskildensis]
MASTLTFSEGFEMTLMETFSGLPDQRKGAALRFSLAQILVMAICAVLCGADNWVEVADWCKDRRQWLKERFGLRLDRGTPSHDTFGDVFGVLDASVFEARFRQWINALAGVVEGVVAIDGKTLRGSGNKGSNALLHMVTAYAVQSGLCLAQEGTCGKGHELTGVKSLLDILILKGCIVTMDALGCQTELAERIVARGGDYLLQVKDNQKNLAEAIREFFEQGGKAGFGKLTVGRIEDIEKDHGRIWTRRYTWINDVSWMDKSMCQAWKKLGGVGMIESVRQIGDEISVEHRYAIGSSGVQTVEMFAKASRSHWGIENGLHWTLDVVFREDQCRTRSGHSARNFSTLRKFVLATLRKEEGSKMGLRRRRTHADRNQDYRESLIDTAFSASSSKESMITT